MLRSRARRGASFLCVTMLASVAITAHAKGDLRKVNHVIIVMQENHSFDNYFGVLPYVPRGPYHAGPCARGDHRCVDGLACEREGSSLDCRNWNLDADAPSGMKRVRIGVEVPVAAVETGPLPLASETDRKSTRLNSS